MYSCSIWSSSRALCWTEGSGWGSSLSSGFFKSSFEIKTVFEKKLPFMTYIPHPPSLDLKSLDLGLRFQNKSVLCDLWTSRYFQKCHSPSYLIEPGRSRSFHFFSLSVISSEFRVHPLFSPQILGSWAYAWEEASDIPDGAKEVEAPGIREGCDDCWWLEEK